MSTETEKVHGELVEAFDLVYQLTKGQRFGSNDPYEKINSAYFRIFNTHLESFLQLLSIHHGNSAILLARTMLELYVKSFYVEFVARKRGDIISEYLDGKKKYPSFVKISKELDDYFAKHGNTQSDHFIQYTKQDLATYEKFSLFSHGAGALLKAFYDHEQPGLTGEQISDVLRTLKGMLITLTMLFCVVNHKQNELGVILDRYPNV